MCSSLLYPDCLDLVLGSMDHQKLLLGESGPVTSESGLPRQEPASKPAGLTTPSMLIG